MSLDAIAKALSPGGALHALAGYAQFCVYEVRPKADNPNKSDKVPVSPRYWGDDTALLTAEQALSQATTWAGSWPVGVGFVFRQTDPFFFLDADGCYSPETGWSPIAQRLMAMLPGAAFEVSSSRTGLHLFGTCEALPHSNRYGPDRLEFYTRDRFAALTGLSAIGNAATPLTPAVQALVAEFFPPAAPRAAGDLQWVDQAPADYCGPADDDDLIARACASVGGVDVAAAFAGEQSQRLTFAQVWEADEDALARAFPASNQADAYDRSRADMSLAQRLAFWTGGNPVRVLRLMERSGLVRDKWDMRPDYLTDLVEKACGACTQYPGSNSAEPKRPIEWTTASLDPFPTSQTPAEVINAWAQNPDTPFNKAWHAADVGPIIRQLAWKFGSNCEAVLEGVKLRGIEDGPELRQAIAAACAACDSWASGDATLLERLPADVQPLTEKLFYGVEQQLEIFQGCAFVARQAKVATPRGELYEQTAFNAMMPAGVYSLDTKQGVTKKPWEAFVGSHLLRHPRVDDVSFRPDLESGVIFSEEGQTFLNNYVPVVPPRRAGDPTPFLQHIELMLPDARDRQILLTWMAAVVQYPGVKFRWAPVLQGWEGNGKGLLQTTLQRAIGHRYTHLAQAGDIGNKFNDWLVGKLLVCVNEVNAAGAIDVIDALKTMVTDDLVATQGKGVQQKTSRNFANFFFTTNRPGAMGKAVEGRRYAVFYTAQQTADEVERDMPNAYFTKLVGWLERGGYEVAIDYLASFPLVDQFNPAGVAVSAPRTSSFEASKMAALGAVEQSILEAVAEGRPGFKGGFVGGDALVMLLKELRKESQVAPNKRRELMKSIGYDWHGALREGRATRPLLGSVSDKQVIYVKVGHPLCELKTAKEIMAKFETAQSTNSGDCPFILHG